MTDREYDGGGRVLQVPGTFLYDRHQGEVQTLVDGLIREVIAVRQGLEDALVLEAVVAELRRRGYTVTPPYPEACAAGCEGLSHRYDCPDWSLPS